MKVREGLYKINHAVHGEMYLLGPHADAETATIGYFLAVFDGIKLAELTREGNA